MKHLSKTLKAGLAALLLFVAQVLMPVQAAFAADNGNYEENRSQSKQVFCNQEGKSGKWKAQIGGPHTEHEYPLIVDGHSVYVQSEHDVTSTMDQQCQALYGKKQATAVNGTFSDTCGDIFNLVFTPAVTPGVTYTSTKVGNTITVTATAQSGYTLTNPNWSQQATDLLTACPIIPTPVTPVAPQVSDPCSTTNDTFTLTAVTGVEYYYVDGQGSHVLSSANPINYADGTDFTIYAQVTDSVHYIIAQDAPTSWTLHFTSTPCVIDTPEKPVVQEICGANNDIVTPADFDHSTINDYSVDGWKDNTYTVTYHAMAGNVFSNEQTTYTYTIYDNVTTCPVVEYTEPTCLSDGTLTLPAAPEDDYMYTYQITGLGFDLSGSLTDSPTVIDSFASGLQYHIEIHRGSWDIGRSVFSDDHTFSTPECLITAEAPVVINCDTVSIPKSTNQIHYVESYTGTTRIVTATAQGKYMLDDGEGNPVESILYTLDFSAFACGKGDITPPAPTPLPTPIELPHTGNDGFSDLLIALVSAAAVYGAVYFAQPRRS